MIRRSKLLRSVKRFGRCRVKGHSINNCEVCQDIQTTSISRAEDKKEFKKTMKDFYV